MSAVRHLSGYRPQPASINLSATDDVFYTPRGLTCYPTSEDLVIGRRARKRQGNALAAMLQAERGDLMSCRPVTAATIARAAANQAQQYGRRRSDRYRKPRRALGLVLIAAMVSAFVWLWTGAGAS